MIICVKIFIFYENCVKNYEYCSIATRLSDIRLCDFVIWNNAYLLLWLILRVDYRFSVSKQLDAFLVIRFATLQYYYIAHIEVHNIEANIITLFAYAGNNCMTTGILQV